LKQVCSYSIGQGKILHKQNITIIIVTIIIVTLTIHLLHLLLLLIIIIIIIIIITHGVCVCVAVPSGESEERTKEKQDVRARFLTEKYVARWRQHMWGVSPSPISLTRNTWLHSAIFSPSSRTARQTACSVVESISQVASHRKEVIDMLTG
jgi:hypothetical protein